MRAPWLLSMLALSGCFYIDVINVAPVARIKRVGTEPVYIKSKPMVLSAADSEDADGDPLVYTWTCASCPGFDQPSETEFSTIVSTHVAVTVELQVTDQHGAVSFASILVPVTDRAPDGTLQVQTPPNADGNYTATRPIVFAAAATDPDNDNLTYAFELHPPPQSDPNKVTTVANGQLFTVTPDVQGTWEVEVKVNDGYGLSDVVRLSVTVAGDAPPCLAATSPAWSPETRIVVPRSAGPRRFAVESVLDDLDGYPGSGIHFRWLVAGPGAASPVELPGHDLADLTLDPTDLEPGDVLAVRVEIADRVARTLPCGVDQAACSIGGNACLQRVTWTVEVR